MFKHGANTHQRQLPTGLREAVQQAHLRREKLPARFCVATFGAV
jgi:hypothetical protein